MGNTTKEKFLMLRLTALWFADPQGLGTPGYGWIPDEMGPVYAAIGDSGNVIMWMKKKG